MGNKGGKLKGKDKKTVEKENQENATENAEDNTNAAENAEGKTENADDKAKTENGEAGVTASENPAEKTEEAAGEEPKQPTDGTKEEASEDKAPSGEKNTAEGDNSDKQAGDKTEAQLETANVHEPQQAEKATDSGTNENDTTTNAKDIDANAKDNVIDKVNEPTEESVKEYNSTDITSKDVDTNESKQESVNDSSKTDATVEHSETKPDPEPKEETPFVQITESKTVADDDAGKQESEHVAETATEGAKIPTKTEIIVTASEDDDKETDATSNGAADQNQESVIEKQAEVADKIENETDEKVEEPKTEVTTEVGKEQAEIKDEEGTKVATEFRWEEGGENVLVAGSFNNWGDKVPLQKKDNVFIGSIEILPGEYTYKYFVDDEWKVNKNQATKEDETGAENNVITVTCG